ncbi:MAG TPA: hypothetical protein VGO86_06705 [Candidatus Dormibacteraeota bacterium]
MHRPDTPSGWATLDRRARILALLALAALALATVAGTWISMRFGQPSTPIYGSGGSAAAAVWTWDGASYSGAPVGGAGPYSNNADMAYDRAHGVLVLWDHGCGKLVMGFTGGCVTQVNRTWTWDGQHWLAHLLRSAPSEVGPGAMVYDSRLERVLYVSGVGQAWAWTGSDWLALAMTGAPRVPARDSASAPSTFAVGYDEGRKLLVFALSSSTWSWDGRTWTAQNGGIEDDRADAHLVYDGSHEQLVYVGNRATWTWDGARWQAHDQPAITPGTGGYDPVRRTVMLVRQDPSACDRTACRTTTWTWDSRSWTQLPTDHAPVLPLTRSGAFLPPMAFDEARGVMVLFASAI